MLKTLASSIMDLRTTEDEDSLRATLLRRHGEGDIEDQSTREETAQSHLFRCSSCQRVYVDTAKQTCSTCDSTVEQIPATLAEAADSRTTR